jgi:hypothetical protein
LQKVSSGIGLDWLQDAKNEINKVISETLGFRRHMEDKLLLIVYNERNLAWLSHKL